MIQECLLRKCLGNQYQWRSSLGVLGLDSLVHPECGGRVLWDLALTRLEQLEYYSSIR